MGTTCECASSHRRRRHHHHRLRHRLRCHHLRRRRLAHLCASRRCTRTVCPGALTGKQSLGSPSGCGDRRRSHFRGAILLGKSRRRRANRQLLKALYASTHRLSWTNASKFTILSTTPSSIKFAPGCFHANSTELCCIGGTRGSCWTQMRPSPFSSRLPERRLKLATRPTPRKAAMEHAHSCEYVPTKFLTAELVTPRTTHASHCCAPRNRHSLTSACEIQRARIIPV